MQNIHNTKSKDNHGAKEQASGQNHSVTNKASGGASHAVHSTVGQGNEPSTQKGQN